jgi:thiol:disulfide interchange protein DsbG
MVSLPTTEVAMRSLVLVLGLLGTPALAAEPPHCSLPGPKPILIADQPAAAPPPATDLPAAGRLPPDLQSTPFAQHVAAAGATVIDWGVGHGMHSMAATAGDHMMFFQVANDGKAAVSGLISDITSAQLMSLPGDRATDLGELHGLRGIFVRSGAQFQMFYSTPDGERVIPGVLWDADGKNLTREQLAHVPDAIPTVQVGDVDPTKSRAAAAAALPWVQKANSGTVGQPSAPHLWMLVDPQCIYSVRAMQQLQSYVASGRLQVSVIPVSILDPEDGGQSTKSALALLSKPAGQLVSAWQAGDVAGAPIPDAPDRLRANQAIAEAIHLQGTPTFVWKKRDGTVGRLDGIPTSVEELVASVPTFTYALLPGHWALRGASYVWVPPERVADGRRPWRLGALRNFAGTDEEAIERYASNNRQADAPGTFRSDHWDEPNVLAHVRLNERMELDGKRVLLIEEIQSDWHQAGCCSSLRRRRPDRTCRSTARRPAPSIRVRSFQENSLYCSMPGVVRGTVPSSSPVTHPNLSRQIGPIPSSIDSPLVSSRPQQEHDPVLAP